MDGALCMRRCSALVHVFPVSCYPENSVLCVPTFVYYT